MRRRPFVWRIREAFGISCDTDGDLGLPIIVLKNDEVDVLLSRIRTVRGHSATRLCCKVGLLVLYYRSRPKPWRILDSKYSPTLADV